MTTIKRFIITMVLVLTSALGSLSTPAYAASYTTEYWNYTTPTSSDYAYWNGKRVVKGRNTTKSEICWMQASLNHCIAMEGLNGSYIAVDASFGPRSAELLRLWQAECKKLGIYNGSVDGSFGAQSIAAMKTVLGDNKKTFVNEPVSAPKNDATIPTDAEISSEFSRLFDQMYAVDTYKPTGFKTPYNKQKTGVNAGAYTYKGYCGLYTANRLLCKGIYSGSLDVNANGNQFYSRLYSLYSNGTLTSGGYHCTFYNGNSRNVEQLLNDIVNNNYTQDILISFPNSSNGSTAYGHVVLIDYIKDGFVHYSDSYACRNVPEGWEHRVTITEFSSRYRVYGNPIGAVKFTK